MGNALRVQRIDGHAILAVLAACTACLPACGGEGAAPTPSTSSCSPARRVVRFAPGEVAQLTATERQRDGSVRDVTAIALWSTTDAGVATVTSGRVTAVAPGRTEVSATLEGARAAVVVQVAPMPAAYVAGGVEYAFDYQLDALGRVSSYRIARRADVDYGTEPWQDITVKECRGDLHGTYECTSANRSMRGEGGRLLVASGLDGIGAGGGTATYRYGPQGLASIALAWRGPGSHDSGSSDVALAYDGTGRLASVVERQAYASVGGLSGVTGTATVTVDATGRLARADIGCVPFGAVPLDCRTSPVTGPGASLATAWTYDAQGFMSSAGTTTYAVDADGWLLGRTTRVGTAAVVDDYAIVRAGTGGRGALHPGRAAALLPFPPAAARSLRVGPAARRAGLRAARADGVDRRRLLRGDQQPPSVAGPAGVLLAEKPVPP